MELFGIVLAIPAAFIASAIYAALLQRLVRDRARLSGALRAGGGVVLALLLAEGIAVVSTGAVRCRELLGPVFWVTHQALFVLGVPALVTRMALQPGRPWWSRWFVAAAAGAVLALAVVLLQYEVSEKLFGINGTEGPFIR
jgi:hypothetical protein